MGGIYGWGAGQIVPWDQAKDNGKDASGFFRYGDEDAPLEGYDVMQSGGQKRSRDGLTDAERLGLGAQKSLQGASAWADEAGSRKAPSMFAATLGDAPQMKASILDPAYLAGGTTIDQSKANEARRYEAGLMSNLYAQSLGYGPSLAGQQLQAGADANMANMMSAQGSKGGMGALAGRQLAMQGAAQGQQTAQAAALARIQEQMNAQQQLGGLSSTVRSQDLGVASQQAQLEQALNFQNQGAKNQFALAQAGFNQQAAAANQGMLGQYGLTQGQFNQGANQQNLSAYLQNQAMGDQAKEWGYGSIFDAWNHAADRDANVNTANADRAQRQGQIDTAERDKLIGAAGLAAGWMAAGPAGGAAGYVAGEEASRTASDRRAKTDIEPGEEDLREFLEAIGTHAYRYKDPAKHGHGRRVSPMAQELERTELGRGAVHEDADGTKVVDYPSLFGTALAAESMHEREIEALKREVEWLKTRRGVLAA